MLEMIPFLAGGLVLGMLHSLEPDHLAAMSTLVGLGRQSLRADAIQGAIWGLGHTLAVGALGLLFIGFGTLTSGRIEQLLEVTVGGVLVYLGLVRMRDATRGPHLHPHRHGELAHAHVHLHARGIAHERPETHLHHSHAPFWIGLLHGLAGSGTILMLAPAFIVDDVRAYLLYVVAFGAASMTAMTAFCATLGHVQARFASRTAFTHRLLAATTGSLALVVGTAWLVRAANGLM